LSNPLSDHCLIFDANLWNHSGFIYHEQVQSFDKPLTRKDELDNISAVSKYRIRTVAQMTGLSPALIRAWEARYGLVAPERTPSGYRVYSDEDVRMLQGAQRLVRQGISPMQVARLPRFKLRDEGTSLPAPAPPIAQPQVSEGQSPLLFAELIDRVIESFSAFDNQRTEELMGPPLLLLPPGVACQRFLVPLLREVGERWHRGELTVAAEHFGTSIIRTKLQGLLEIMRHGQKGQRVLCICPPGEYHDVGLLMFALDAASQGWDPLYLGPNVPMVDLGAAVRSAKPELVAMSLVLRREAAELRQLLQDAKAAIGDQCPLLVGGRALFGFDDMVREVGCYQLPRSGQLADVLPSR